MLAMAVFGGGDVRGGANVRSRHITPGRPGCVRRRYGRGGIAAAAEARDRPCPEGERLPPWARRNHCIVGSAAAAIDVCPAAPCLSDGQ